MTTNDEIIDKEDERLGRVKKEDNLFGYQSVSRMLAEAYAEGHSDGYAEGYGEGWDAGFEEGELSASGYLKKENYS